MKKLSTKVKIILAGIAVVVALGIIIDPPVGKNIKTEPIDPPVGTILMK